MGGAQALGADQGEVPEWGGKGGTRLDAAALLLQQLQVLAGQRRRGRSRG